MLLLFLPFVYFTHTSHIVHEINVTKKNEMWYRGIKIRLSVNNDVSVYEGGYFFRWRFLVC